MKRTESLALAQTYLGTRVCVTVDRKLGSKHPKHDFVYEVNYGEVAGELAPDGEYLDAYVLGVDEPLDSFTGICIAIMHRNDDDDDKLIVVPEGNIEMTDQEMVEKTRFQEQWFDSVVVREVA